jgi:uncharacterized protein YdcH (DUF465 family)
MSHVLHDLATEFPGDIEILHELKLADAHFRGVSDRYHDINREIHRIETSVEPASDERLEGLKKQRLTMLDEVAQVIVKARA